jgi:mitogen-activated protein kinase kinase
MFSEKNNLNSLKLLDMGLSVKLETYFEKSRCGTLIYMAPEQLLGKPYTLSVDIWAAGIILYILCSGGQHPIFTKRLDTKGYTEKATKLEKFEFTNKFPKLARNLFLVMCKFDYNLRLATYKLTLHPWITRDKNSELPFSNLDSWRRKGEMEKFKTVSFIFLK